MFFYFISRAQPTSLAGHICTINCKISGYKKELDKYQAFVFVILYIITLRSLQSKL